MSDALIYICFQRITTGAYLFQTNLSGRGGGGLIETGDLFERGGLFNLEKTMVSILHNKN